MSNYLKKKSFVRIHDLGEGLEIESENILDYYTYKPDFDLKNNLTDFIKTYSNYSGIENLYFIFGNQSVVSVMGYQKLEDKTISVETNSETGSLEITRNLVASKTFLIPGEDIKIIIDKNEYDFQLKSWENFYFIMSQEVGGEKYVVTN